MGLFKNKEADMCITLTSLSSTKAQAMDSSYFVREEDMSIVIPYPKSQVDKLDTFVAPFKREVNHM